LITIEGKNCGSILSSYGEEGREGTADIEIYFMPHEQTGIDVPTMCHEIAHYHNTTQLFCILDRMSAGEASYTLVVNINGHTAHNWCGGDGWPCRVQGYIYKTTKIETNGIRPGNLVAPSEPKWTNLYSYDRRRFLGRTHFCTTNLRIWEFFG